MHCFMIICITLIFILLNSMNRVLLSSNRIRDALKALQSDCLSTFVTEAISLFNADPTCTHDLYSLYIHDHWENNKGMLKKVWWNELAWLDTHCYWSDYMLRNEEGTIEVSLFSSLSMSRTPFMFLHSLWRCFCPCICTFQSNINTSTPSPPLPYVLLWGWLIR